MDKIQFNKLEITDQIEFVNKELEKGESLRNISNNLSMSKTTIRDRALKIGFIYNKELSQYSKDNNIEIQPYKNIIKASQKTSKLILDPIKKDSTKELQKYDNDILELINKKAEILEMLKDYKSNSKVIHISEMDINSLTADMQTNIINKSIKVYEPIYKAFDKVCNQYGNYKKQDLISMALLEFTDKYKK